MTAIDTSLQSIHDSFARVDNAAQKIASVGNSSTTDQVDLSAQMVSLMEARNQVGASVKAIQTADDMQSNLLSILA
jgi:hypothetical protein